MMLRELFTPRRPLPHVAPLTCDHAEAAAAIHRQSFARPWDALELERLIANKAVFGDGVFAGASTALLGFALSRLVHDEAEILTIAVSTEARGHGAGTTLLQRHLARLAEAGARTVFLEVDEGNEPALNMYRRAGFIQIGSRPGYYAKPDGSQANALTMRLQMD